MIYVKNNTEPQTIYIPKDGDGVYIPSGGGSYNQGFIDGKAWQKAQLTSGTFTENGDYFREDGWDEITIAVPQGDYAEGYADGYASGSTDGYSSGYTQGYEDRGDLLGTLIVSANNTTYTSETGYNEVVVAITGITSGFVSRIDQNGHYEYDAHDFLTPGWDHITLDVNVPQTGTTGTQIPLTAVTQETTLTQYGTYYFVYDENTPTELLRVLLNSHINLLTSPRDNTEAFT